MSTLVFLGDVWLLEPIKCKVHLGVPYIFNLEAPITKCSKPVQGKINLKTDNPYFQETFGRDPLAVCIANNHISDYGQEGFLDTIEALTRRGIKYFGAGTLENNCNNPLFLEIDGGKIALMGYVCPSAHPIFAQGQNPGVMPIDLDRISKDIKVAKQNKANQIIVQLHWGEEEVYLPKPEDVKVARHIIDLGADLIIGHHAHCIQPWEIYKGKYIFYGLGNTIFPLENVPSYCDTSGQPTRQYIKHQRYWNRESLMVEYSLHFKSCSIRHLVFNQQILKPMSKNRLNCLNYSDTSYEQKYSWAYRLSMIRDAIGTFLCRPKLPKLSHLWFLFSLFGKKDKS